MIFNVIFFEEMAPEWLMLEMIKYFLGGPTVVWLGIYSYLTDISSHKTRTMRIALIDGVLFIAMAIGQAIGGIIYTTFGYFIKSYKNSTCTY